jgi:hypothetical protein
MMRKLIGCCHAGGQHELCVRAGGCQQGRCGRARWRERHRPAKTKAILDERKKGEFKDWADLEQRVKGIGGKNAAKLSAAGLVVNGKSMEGAPAMATPASKTSKASKADKSASAASAAK